MPKAPFACPLGRKRVNLLTKDRQIDEQSEITDKCTDKLCELTDRWTDNQMKTRLNMLFSPTLPAKAI